MTLKQAIDSKLPFKRPTDKVWYKPNTNEYYNDFSSFRYQDIFKDDWIVHEGPINKKMFQYPGFD